MPRPQFTLRTLLLAMLVVAAFFGGVHFERERQRRKEEAAALAAQRWAASQPAPWLVYYHDVRFWVQKAADKSPDVDSKK